MLLLASLMLLPTTSFGEEIPTNAKSCVLKVVNLMWFDKAGSPSFEIRGPFASCDGSTKRKLSRAGNSDRLMSEVSGQLAKLVEKGFTILGCQTLRETKTDGRIEKKSTLIKEHIITEEPLDLTPENPTKNLLTKVTRTVSEEDIPGKKDLSGVELRITYCTAVKH